MKQRYTFLAAVIITIVISLQSGISDGKNEIVFDTDATVFYAINYFVWAFLFPFIRSFVGSGGLSIRDIIPILSKSLAVIFVHFMLSNAIYFVAKLVYDPMTIHAFASVTGNYLYESLIRRTIDMSLILVIVHMVDNYIQLNQRREQVSLLERQLNETKFETLKAQLNPHFLFNALHSVYTLIGYEDEKAKKMVIKISNLLRKIVDESDNHVIPLSEELEYINDYLSIETERFHDRLNVEHQIQEEAKDVLVPMLVLQPLIENAIKHGIALLEDGGVITISAALNENKMILEIINPVALDSKAKLSASLGIGLNNVKERLYADDKAHELKTALDNDHFKATIIIQNPKKV